MQRRGAGRALGGGRGGPARAGARRRCADVAADFMGELAQASSPRRSARTSSLRSSTMRSTPRGAWWSPFPMPSGDVSSRSVRCGTSATCPCASISPGWRSASTPTRSCARSVHGRGDRSARACGRCSQVRSSCADAGRNVSSPRVAVGGTSFGARVHVPALRTAGFEVVALVGQDLARTARRAERLGVGHPCASLTQALDLLGIDAVTIASPPATHAGLALEAIDRRCHVVCEKPFALNAPEGAMVAEAAHPAGVTALMGDEFRLLPERAVIARAIRWADRGAAHSDARGAPAVPRRGGRPAAGVGSSTGPRAAAGSGPRAPMSSTSSAPG